LALWLLHAAEHRPDAVVLLRDDDGQTERRKGLEQARDTSKMGVPIVIGLAHLKRECWVLAGFEPQNEEERRRLEHLSAQLGFDPRSAADRLTARRPPSALRNPKHVLDNLTGGDRDREADCWGKTGLNLLRDRGQGTGLADYLDEVLKCLAPLIRGGQSRL
jgi:hypothetical protein